MNKKIKSMTLDGAFIAIISIMALVPFLGFIPLGIYSATIITIPVMVYSLLAGLKKGIIMGVSFGILSMIVALMRPSGYFDVFFQNPLVSVLPRVMWGFICGSIGYLLLRLPLKIRNNQYLIGIASFVLSFIHSFLVLSILFLMHHQVISTNEGASIWVIITTYFFTATLVEALLASILVPIFFFPLKKVYQIYINNAEN